MFNKMTTLPTLLLFLPLFQLSLCNPGQKCTLIDAKGGKLIFQQGDVIRRYTDYEGRCSSWCKCKAATTSETFDLENQGEVECHKLKCLEGGSCEAPLANVVFGGRLFIKDRGECTCQSGVFICEQPEKDTPVLANGIFLLVGYSKEEVNELRDQLEDEQIRGEAGYVTRNRGEVYYDVQSRIQAKLIRLQTETADCRISLLYNDGKNNLVFRAQRYAINVRDNDKFPSWTHGGPERACLPALTKLSRQFELGGAARYQLILSSVKQMKVVSLLPNLDPDFAVPLAANSNFLSLWTIVFGWIFWLDDVHV